MGSIGKKTSTSFFSAKKVDYLFIKNELMYKIIKDMPMYLIPYYAKNNKDLIKRFLKKN